MSTKDKDGFLSMMNHELITPLVSIQGFAELLKDPGMGDLNEDQKNAVEEIYNNSKILGEIIENMLNLQKIEMGALGFIFVQKNVIELMAEQFKLLQPLMDKKNIEFVNSTKTESEVWADISKISQILKKLVDNATSFVPENGKIEIGAKDGDKEVIFFVKDNGEGIPKKDQADLFTKFYQSDTSLTRKHGGTGLSLAICKGFVEGMKGKIWVESEPGNGTTFFFSIPKTE